MFVCYRCGSLYDSQLAWCWSCVSSGTIIHRPRRPASALAGRLQVASARDLAARAWTLLVSEFYPALHFLVGALVLLVGGPGAGKSTMLLRLLDGLPGPAVLYAAEEGHGPTLTERLGRLAIRRRDLHVLAGGGLDDLAAELAHLHARSLGIDSLGVVHLVPVELRHLQAIVGLQVVAATQQVVKDGSAAGPNAWSHEADVILHLNDMRWQVVKSRYQPVGLTGGVL